VHLVVVVVGGRFVVVAGGGCSSVVVGGGSPGSAGRSRVVVVVVAEVEVVVLVDVDVDGCDDEVVIGEFAGRGCCPGGTGSTAARSDGAGRWPTSPLSTPAANRAAVTAPIMAPTATRP
jgi:hypothetical protein